MLFSIHRRELFVPSHISILCVEQEVCTGILVCNTVFFPFKISMLSNCMVSGLGYYFAINNSKNCQNIILSHFHWQVIFWRVLKMIVCLKSTLSEYCVMVHGSMKMFTCMYMYVHVLHVCRRNCFC